jgi:galactose mutarotase-like enzyme
MTALTETIQLAAGDLRVHVLPERGLDIGRAWLGDTEFAWISPLDEGPWQGEFPRSFTGGLLTTCGLRNVGSPSEGQPQHGWYSSLPARDVEVAISSATGRMVETDVPGDWLELTREITVDEGGVTVRDTTVNQGWEPVPAPLLYHVNFWWHAVDIDSTAVEPRDDDARAGDWHAPGEPGPERVYEHVGASRAVVTHESVRSTVTSTLQRLWQWIHPAYGVLGIEPANCSVLGRAHDRAEGRLPVLEPGEERLTELRIAVEAA